MYKDNFQQEQITSSNDMEVLKTFSPSKIELELKITKICHIKRLMRAIAKLRNPTSGGLVELRNKWVAIFAVFNAIWMTLIYTLATQEKLLSVANSNPVVDYPRRDYSRVLIHTCIVFNTRSMLQRVRTGISSSVICVGVGRSEGAIRLHRSGYTNLVKRPVGPVNKLSYTHSSLIVALSHV
ncbi:hypothetical protein DPMN_031427 [Dreissena polymorpha]|uniref:SAM domain-containing protein n=1 Tax=Dreissena polymorpha TaxID=45954 RepID=A0A9D4M2T0_DREPO|nr:hypothetical protein DPMN_031427 [Dreissena polymorpha]